MKRKLLRKGRLLAGVSAVTLLLASWQAWSLVRPVQKGYDVIVHSNAGSALVEVTYDTQTEDPHDVPVTVWDLSLQPQVPGCEPSTTTPCQYTLRDFSFRVDSFTTFDLPVTNLRARLKSPVTVVDDGMAIRIPHEAVFVVNAALNGHPRSLEVSPAAPPGGGLQWLFDLLGLGSLDDLFSFQITLDRAAQTAAIYGTLAGAQEEADGKVVRLSVVLDLTANGFENLPPVANAGADQAAATSCYAAVALPAQSTDPTGDIAWQHYSYGTLPVGPAGTTVNLLPGNYAFRLDVKDVHGSSDSDHVKVAVTHDGALPLPSGGRLVEFSLPSGLSFDDVAISAENSLKISDRVKVRKAGGGATTLVNQGPAGQGILSWFHADSVITGDVWSRPKTWLLERANVSGILRTSTLPDRQNNTFVQQVIQPFSFTEGESLAFVVPAAGPRGEVGHIEPNQVRAVVPGDYGFASVKSSARIELESGIYRFSQLWMEPGSRMVLSGDEPTIVVVDDGATLRGSVEADPGGGLVVVQLGASEVIATSPFVGAVLAPDAKLTLNSSNQTKHRGAFFAHDVQVDSDSVIEHETGLLDALEVERDVCALTPKVVCVQPSGSGYVAHFTYENAADLQPVRVRAGFGNRITPGSTDQGQPEVFVPDYATPPSFTVPFAAGQQVSWVLGTRRATASQGSPQCP